MGKKLSTWTPPVEDEIVPEQKPVMKAWTPPAEDEVVETSKKKEPTTAETSSSVGTTKATSPVSQEPSAKPAQPSQKSGEEDKAYQQLLEDTEKGNYGLKKPFVEELKNAPAPLMLKQDAEKNARKVVSDFQKEITSKPESQGLVTDAYLAATNIPGSLNQAFVSGMAAMPKTVAVLAQKLDQLTGAPEKSIEEYATYQLGDYVENKARELGITTLQNPDQAGFMTSTVPQAVGSMLSMMLLGGRGAATNPFAASQSVAKEALTTLTSKTAMVGAMQAAVPEFEAAKAAGKTDEEAFNVFLQNIPGGLTESVQMANMFGRLNRMTNNGLMNAIKLSTANGLEEASQEAIQQYLTNKVAQGTYDPNRDLKEGIGEGAGAGFIVGFLMPGAMAAMEKMSPEQQKQTKAVLQQMLERGYYVRTPEGFLGANKTPSQVITEAKSTVKSSDDANAVSQAVDKILNEGTTAIQSIEQPVGQAATGQEQQGTQAPVQQGVTTVGQGTAETAASVLEDTTKPTINNEQGTETNALSQGAEQERSRSQQEDAEAITREVQDAISSTPGAQRSAREIKKQQDVRLEANAREKGIFVEDPRQQFGDKIHGGTEQDVYESKDGKNVIKVNGLSNHGGWSEFWDRLNLQKQLFPETAYNLIGFTKSGGRLSAITEQPYIDGTAVPRKELIDDLAKRGFYQIHPKGSPGENQFYNPELGVRLTDVHGENVIKDADGNIRYIDPMLDYENPFVDEESKQYFNEQQLKYGNPYAATEPQLTAGDNYQMVDGQWQVKQADGTWINLIGSGTTKQTQNKELTELRTLKTELEKEDLGEPVTTKSERSRITDLPRNTIMGRVRGFFFDGGKVNPENAKNETGIRDTELQGLKDYTSKRQGITVEQVAERLAEQYGEDTDFDASDYRQAVIDLLSQEAPAQWYANQRRDEDEDFINSRGQRYDELNRISSRIAELETEEEATQQQLKEQYENERRVYQGAAGTRPTQTEGTSTGQQGEAQVSRSPEAIIRENGNADQSKQAVEELGKLTLTHVSGLGMGQNQAKGTYVSTEEENRYATEEKPAEKVKVKIKKPFVTDGDTFANIQRAVIEKRFGKKQIEDLTDSEMDLLAAMMTEHFVNEGYDAIYFPQTETQEGELVVFDRNNVEIGVFEEDIVKSPILDRINRAFLKIGATILKNADQLMAKARELVQQGENVRWKIDSNGEVLGFEYNGKIYLNGEKITANTTMEEAGHVWVSWAKEARPDLYQAGLEKVERSRYLEDVINNENYQKEALKQGKPGNKKFNDYLREEALAKAIADEGARFVNESRKQGFKEWVRSLWRSVIDAFGIRDLSAEQVKGMTLQEFAKKAAADIFSGKQEPGYASVKDVKTAIKLAQAINDATTTAARRAAKREYSQVDKALRNIIDNIAYIHSQLGKEITKIGDCP